MKRDKKEIMNDIVKIYVPIITGYRPIIQLLNELLECEDLTESEIKNIENLRKDYEKSLKKWEDFNVSKGL